MVSSQPIPSANLTHEIIKVLYETYNELGFGYQEKHYYRCIKLKLLAIGFQVQEQLSCKILALDKIVGLYYLDFLINRMVVLEIKVANAVYPQHIRQVLGYLKANNLKLGLIGVIGPHGVIVKRVIN